MAGASKRARDEYCVRIATEKRGVVTATGGLPLLTAHLVARMLRAITTLPLTDVSVVPVEAGGPRTLKRARHDTAFARDADATLQRFVRDELLPPVVDSFIGGARAHDFGQERQYAARLAASIVAAEEA